MLGFVGWMVGIAWKALMVAMAFTLFKVIVTSGKGTIKEMCDTLIAAIRVGTAKLQAWLFSKYKETNGQQKEEQVQ